MSQSPLAAEATGYVDVDKETLQHLKFKNVFSLGDCANLPTSKTAAAISSEVRTRLMSTEHRRNDVGRRPGSSSPSRASQGAGLLPVFQSLTVKNNLRAAMKGEAAKSKYGGYASCPLITGVDTTILAEFSAYTGQVREAHKAALGRGKHPHRGRGGWSRSCSCHVLLPQPQETFFFNQAKPRKSMYFLKAEVMPELYFDSVSRGHRGRHGATSFSPGVVAGCAPWVHTFVFVSLRVF